jgi:hypothetical protein
MHIIYIERESSDCFILNGGGVVSKVIYLFRSFLGKKLLQKARWFKVTKVSICDSAFFLFFPLQLH